MIGQFSLDWHPLVARVGLTGEGIGQLRTLQTRDGKEIVERLEEIDDAKRSYRYALVAGIPASHYTGMIEVKPKGSGSVAEWRVEFLANNQPDIAVRTHGVDIAQDRSWKSADPLRSSSDQSVNHPNTEEPSMLYQTINPYTEELVQTFPLHTDGEIESIIAKAEKTYATDWSRRSLAARKAIIKKAASLLRENVDEFARLSTLEMGKLFREARSEVRLSAAILEYFADNAEAFLAPEKLSVKKGEAVIESAPLGVLFCIEPWNYPYYQLARVAGPNLMLGNTIICKHAPNVPQCALAFEKLFLDAGAPAGTWTNVFITNEQSAKIIADSRIRGVALTGSERAGSAVASEAGQALKKSTMELGGSDPFIVLDDADLDTAVKWAVWGRAQEHRSNLHRGQALHRSGEHCRRVPEPVQERARESEAGRSDGSRNVTGAALHGSAPSTTS